MNEKEDGGFADMLSAQLDQNTWLGDAKVVGGLLRTTLSGILKADHPDEESFAGDVKERCEATARIFLGQDPKFQGSRWNTPGGGLDAWVGKKAGIDSEVPLERVAGAIAAMVAEALDLIDASQGMLKEQWTHNVDEILDRYVKLFLGLPGGHVEVASEETV